MADLTEYEETATAVTDAIASERDPLRQVAAVVRLAADDAAGAWSSLASDLGRAMLLADKRQRRQLARAKARAEQMAKLAEKMRSDCDGALTAVSP